MGKFDTANDIVIQSGFRNPEYKDLDAPALLDAAPTATSDGVFMPDSERASVLGFANSGSSFECNVWGLLKTEDKWVNLGTFWPIDAGAIFPIPNAGLFHRIVAVVPTSEQSEISTLKLGYPVDE